MAQKLDLSYPQYPTWFPFLCWTMKAVVPLPRHNEEVLIQPFASLGEALDKPNLIVPLLHIEGLTPYVLEVVAPVFIMMG